MTSVKPKVSVVTACFNALEGLRRTVESVADQTYPSIEHIIVDGGSSDGTREYLETLGENAVWISEPDKGIADAMNKGAALAKGDYLLFLHAEDTFRTRNALDETGFETSQDDLVSCHVMAIREGGGESLLRARPFCWLTLFKMTSPHQGLLVRKRLFQELSGFNPGYRIAMDYDFLLRAARSRRSLRVSDTILSNMPATGVSTRLDWQSVRERLREDRRLQRNGASLLETAALFAFWLIYPPFKWIRHAGFKRK